MNTFVKIVYKSIQSYIKKVVLVSYNDAYNCL